MSFCEISYLGFLLKFVNMFWFLLQLDKNNTLYVMTYMHLWSLVTIDQMRAKAEEIVEHCALSTISCEGQMSVFERYQSCISLPTVSELLIVIVLMIHKEILYCGLEYMVFAVKVFTNLIPRDNNGANTLEVSYSVDISWLVI